MLMKRGDCGRYVNMMLGVSQHVGGGREHALSVTSPFLWRITMDGVLPCKVLERTVTVMKGGRVGVRVRVMVRGTSLQGP